MYKKPRFKPHLHIETVGKETVYLLSEKEHFALSGNFYVKLAPLLDGNHSLDEIVGQLKSETSVMAIYHALVDLKNKGYLSDAERTIPDSEAAFWSLLDLDSTKAIEKLQNTTVSLVTCGNIESESFQTALSNLNIPVAETGDLTVVLTDDYLQPTLKEFNHKALSDQKPWLLVKPVGGIIWLGPIFVPEQTGCWECLAHRLRGNREVETSVQNQLAIDTPFPISRAFLPNSLTMGINWAAIEIAKYIAKGSHPQLEGKILTFNLTSLSLEEHTLVKRPQCSSCGKSVDLHLQKPEPVILQNRQKQFTNDGGHRCFSPEQTLKKYEHHISSITGIVSSLPKLKSSSDLIHVYGAIHKNGTGKSNNLTHLWQRFRRQSAGKGKTDRQSKASGFCEAIERYSGIFTGEERRIKGIYSQMSPVAIHPNDCMQFSSTQYQTRELLNSKHSKFAWIPEPFDSEREIEWTPLWSLTNKTFKYLPTAYCYYDYPHSKDFVFCLGDSNGSAAGNTLEEAILQGFMELVERDCVAMWWYNRLQKPSVDLDSFDEPYLQALRDYYYTQNYQLWILDITNDLGIPSFAALARRIDKTPEEICLGFGTHFEPKIAILRAVTELNQMSTMFFNRETEIKLELDDPDMKYWMENATVANQPYLAPDINVKSKVYADYPQMWSEDLKQDVLTCVDIAAKHGMETLVLDQTRPDIGLNVVKVVVPGMCHFWPRFAPGRLYDIPVKLGWLSSPLQESELNPILMFF